MPFFSSGVILRRRKAVLFLFPVFFLTSHVLLGLVGSGRREKKGEWTWGKRQHLLCLLGRGRKTFL